MTEIHKFQTLCNQGLYTVGFPLESAPPLVICIHKINACLRCISWLYISFTCKRCNMSYKRSTGAVAALNKWLIPSNSWLFEKHLEWPHLVSSAADLFADEWVAMHVAAGAQRLEEVGLHGLDGLTDGRARMKEGEDSHSAAQTHPRSDLHNLDVVWNAGRDL